MAAEFVLVVVIFTFDAIFKQNKKEKSLENLIEISAKIFVLWIYFRYMCSTYLI